MTSQETPVAPHLLRFAAAYAVILVVSIVIVAALKLKLGSGANAGALVGAAFYAAAKFAQAHRRPFSRAQFHKMLWGSFAVDVVVQLLLVGVVMPGLFNTGAMALALFIVAIIHLPAIAFVYSGWMMKFVIAGAIKRQARLDARGRSA